MARIHLHLISDSTGETVRSVARACLVQFEPVDVVEHFWPMARTVRAMTQAIENIAQFPGPVIFTVVDLRLRRQLVDACHRMEVPCLSILDPVMAELGALLGARAGARPGRQHAMNAAYFRRIEAMNWAMAHDDGLALHELEDADVVLVGVSRTSKTPTCIYLANHGVQAANVPFVPGSDLPPELDRLQRPLVVGLTKDPTQLVQIRRARLNALRQEGFSAYIDPEEVRKEITEARRYFVRREWPIIDVTRRAIEETAAEVLRILARRRAGESEATRETG